MNNQIHSWKSVIVTDTKEQNRLHSNMHCYKYELQFNSFDPISEDKLDLFQCQLNTAFEKAIGGK